jgi:hypothetical protein
MTSDATVPVQPQLTIEVADVGAMYTEALRRGDEVVYPLTEEPGGARRFFVRDPNGVVVMVVGPRMSEDGAERRSVVRDRWLALIGAVEGARSSGHACPSWHGPDGHRLAVVFGCRRQCFGCFVFRL